MKNPTSKKLNKSTKYYLMYGAASIILILALLVLYAAIAHIDILAWFKSKYAFIIYGAILIYITIGITLVIHDKIKEM